MTTARATHEALAITKIVLASCDLKAVPNENSANDLADFIGTLAKRLEKINED